MRRGTLWFRAGTFTGLVDHGQNNVASSLYAEAPEPLGRLLLGGPLDAPLVFDVQPVFTPSYLPLPMLSALRGFRAAVQALVLSNVAPGGATFTNAYVGEMF